MVFWLNQSDAGLRKLAFRSSCPSSAKCPWTWTRPSPTSFEDVRARKGSRGRRGLIRPRFDTPRRQPRRRASPSPRFTPRPLRRLVAEDRAALELAIARVRVVPRTPTPRRMKPTPTTSAWSLVGVGPRFLRRGSTCPGGQAAYPSSVYMNAIPATGRRRAPDRHVRAHPQWGG